MKKRIAYIRMSSLQPCPQAKGNYTALRPHNSTLGVHYPAFGPPRPEVYGVPQAGLCTPQVEYVSIISIVLWARL